ncbi:MAG: 4Fe-4S ferredoxin [Syntrophaceae bacterium CG2_30_49_12]|nr:MAG: 4Fe-4S ferredoxin [Syntrophaceae bacterium CG2_30_49_12]PIP08384.1 MAG: 4Fe-4S ferredoxin [Syntrophobacterales bacterium CG23_combo_of_CG06-09_8_20_14_all_48_27]PJA49160.1 MAG: 4Fe-4S ferredoxin [Syntrophobacterales bacterium CG_4_9_14_3_um_filter_49_8]PJC74887.1 MAG: 4Fe-4S ferredoxin [Syntrophobacterales bacterium CG_4_8_14_3_um_filter_49_14]
MKTDRRGFLKIGGLGILGFAARPLVDVLLRGDLVEASPAPDTLAGKRWAMAVNVSKCKEGCRDCIVACHSVHNVPDLGNPKDEVKWIWTESYKKIFPEQEQEFDARGGKPVVVLCNHCDNPPCVRVCPTKATFKRSDGIVMMDYHRCIGCRFCMAACPYGSRSLNWRDPRPFIKKINPEFPTRTRGVVEKCDFCVERLAKGLIPACVEACKEKALVFGNLKESGAEIREILRANHTIRRRPWLGTGPQIYYIV